MLYDTSEVYRSILILILHLAKLSTNFIKYYTTSNYVKLIHVTLLNYSTPNIMKQQRQQSDEEMDYEWNEI